MTIKEDGPLTFPKNTKILLVEDNRINQAVVIGVLSSWGVSADIANNGQEALDILNKQLGSAYQLILMDCQMPTMDGYEASQIIRSGQIQEIPHDIPIIAMTANTMDGDKEKCLAAGMSDYLSKPVDADILLEKMEHWLNRSKVNQLQSNDGNDNFIDVSTDVITAFRTPNTETLTKTKVVKATSPDLTDTDTWQYNQLLVRMRNNQVMIKKLVEMFIEDNVDVKLKLEQAIVQNDLLALKSIAHKTKGSARNLSFVSLGSTLNSLESAVNEHKIDNLSELYQQFIREYDNLMPLLTKYITN